MKEEQFIKLSRKGCNLIKVYDELTQFTERYLPDKFYLPSGSTRREDIRWNLFREIIANLCVHADFSTGYACFFHVFKDRVVTKNPTRLSPEIPEGELTLQQNKKMAPKTRKWHPKSEKMAPKTREWHPKSPMN